MKELELQLIAFHNGYEAKVAVELLVIEAKTNHKTVRNFKAAEFHRYLDDPAGRAVKQRTDPE